MMAPKQRWQRVQVLLPRHQFQALQERAARRRMSMGALVREALDRELSVLSIEERLAMVDEIAAMDAPVADWPQMKRELLEAQLEPHGFDMAVLQHPDQQG